MPRSTGLIFLWVTGGDWRKIPFDDQRRRTFKMASMVAILGVVSFDDLMNDRGSSPQYKLRICLTNYRCL
jgi:hypothetical protein